MEQPKKLAKTLDTYTKVYKLRATGREGATIEVSIPKAVIERAAKRCGLSITEFIERYQAVAHYNNFDGVYYRFEAINPSDALPPVVQESVKE